jgi:hypothetical protein
MSRISLILSLIVSFRLSGKMRLDSCIVTLEYPWWYNLMFSTTSLLVTLYSWLLIRLSWIFVPAFLSRVLLEWNQSRTVEPMMILVSSWWHFFKLVMDSRGFEKSSLLILNKAKPSNLTVVIVASRWHFHSWSWIQ